MQILHKFSLLVIFFLLIASIGGNIPAQQQGEDLRASLFNEIDQVKEKAESQMVQLLSPGYYKKGMEGYQTAEKYFRKGKKLEKIKARIQSALTYFRKAMEIAKTSEVTLATALNARSDAERANAPAYTPELWQKAEEKFKDAAHEIEDGDLKAAQKKGSQAEDLYRQAELAAIKASYLADTWDLLKQAEEQDVPDVAPKTYKKARELALEAEKELNENRYDTDRPRGLAQQANYEARHAIYLAKIIRQMKKKKTSMEDLILVSEEPLRRVAAALDMVAEFDEGLGPVGDMVVEKIKALRDSLTSLRQKLQESQETVASLNARVEELKAQLGNIAEQKSKLAQHIEAEAKIRQQFAQVEKLFTRKEARILREGDNIIIRLVGLNFPVGKSIILPRYFALLKKVQEAIAIFPNCSVTVEGHTDSYGSDRLNLRLSQKRAEAVRAYLLANMDIDTSRVEAVGYGESRPIANNETPEGRRKNRRIDIVIHPNLPGLEASSLNIEQADEKAR